VAQKTYTRLGADLALTRYTGVPASVPLASADSWGSVDLSIGPGGRGGLQLNDAQDLRMVSGRENLAQALIIRLLTPRGDLAVLGHPNFGSRLISLIGQLNDETTRNLARLYTIEALNAEPRVKKVLDLTIDVPRGRPDTIQLNFSVLPLNDSDPLALGLEVQL
jgi:phage baseplate assembly protein W